MKKRDPHDPAGEYEREDRSVNTFCAREGAWHEVETMDNPFERESENVEPGIAYELFFEWRDKPMTYNEALHAQNIVTNILWRSGYKISVIVTQCDEFGP